MSDHSMRHPNLHDGEPPSQPEGLSPEEADAHEAFLIGLAIELRMQNFWL